MSKSKRNRPGVPIEKWPIGQAALELWKGNESAAESPIGAPRRSWGKTRTHTLSHFSAEKARGGFAAVNVVEVKTVSHEMYRAF